MAFLPIVKRIVIGIAALIGLVIVVPLILALFVKSDYSVERSVVIDRPKQEVFDYIRYLKNQDNYSVWASMDPDMRQEFRGVDGTVGFVSAWEGNDDVGKGEQEIVGITEGERIDYALRFIEPFEGFADTSLITESLDENRTRVRWTMDSSMPYPFNLMLLFMDMEEMIGNDLQTGLENLKLVLEQE
jgi:hypothetical protein